MFHILVNLLIGLGSYLFLPKRSVVQFILLPDDLCHEIVLKFLPLLEVVRMDTAFCNLKERKWFLEILQCYFINTHFLASFREWQWIYLRSVRVNKLCLSPRCFNAHKQLILPVNCSEICELQLFNLKINECILESFINQCPKLTSIWVDNADSFTDNVALKISGSILKQLQITNVNYTQYSIELTFIYISHFAKYCTNLTEFDLHLTSENDNTSTNDALVKLITNNKGLVKVTLHCGTATLSDTLLDTIDTHCQQIQRIYMKNCDTISFSRVSEFVVKRQEQLLWISLNEKFGGCFSFMNKASHKSDVRHRLLDIKGLDVDCSQRVVDFLAKVTRFERVYFTCMTWLINCEVTAALAKYSPNINFLVLSDSGGYDLSMFKELFQNCQKLNRLLLTHYDHVSNMQMEAIFSVPNNITALDVCNHASLNIDTILTILETNPQICALRCLFVDNVDLSALQSAIVTQGFRHVTLSTEPTVELIELE